MSFFNRRQPNQGSAGNNGNNGNNNGGGSNSNQNSGGDGQNGSAGGTNQNGGGGNNGGNNLPNPFAAANNNNNGNDGGNGGNGGGNGGQGGNAGSQPNAQDQAKQRREYYAQTGLYQNLDFGQFQKDVMENNAEGVAGFMQQMSENAVNVAILSSQKLIRSAVDKAVNDASDNATARVRNDMAVEMMHTQLDFTRNPAIKPMAEQVLNGFIAQGKDAIAAVELTKQYFNETAKAMGFSNQNNGQRPGNRGFNGAPPMGNNDNSAGAGDDDWLDILTGQTSAQ